MKYRHYEPPAHPSSQPEQPKGRPTHTLKKMDLAGLDGDHQVLVEVTNKKLANHFRKSDSTRHAEAHIPVGRNEKSIPRYINLGLTRRHHPVTGTPS